MTIIINGASRRRGDYGGDPPAIPAATTPPTLTWTSDETTVVEADGDYNAFPGVVTCPNGDILAMYRDGLVHQGSGSLVAVRSTDDGATWSAPAVAFPSFGLDGYGTATLSRVDGDRIALVTWTRPLAGGTPDVDGTRVFLSSNNGATWSSPYVVDTVDWLGKYNVSESALIYRSGWYYLGVWGEAADSPASSFRAGVVRSRNLTTWTRVALFDTGSTSGFNEIGVGNLGEHLVAVIRKESGGYRWTAISANGDVWTDETSTSLDGSQGAPKLSVDNFAGFNLFPLRGTDNGGWMCAVDSGGHLSSLGDLHPPTSGRFIYGQVCKLSDGSGGVIYATEDPERIRWRTFTIT